MNELALFAGGGGGILASRLLGWNTVAAVEIKEYAREVLLQRQRDRLLESFPVWDNVCTFDGRPWRGLIDVLSGGFPCQDISAAWDGPGLAGKRSGLWKEYLRIVEECWPDYVFAENVANLRCRGLRTVIEDLARLGYGARWLTIDSSWFGIPHPRPRMFVLAHRQWTPVVFTGDCHRPSEDEAICPHCAVDYSECPCPGPHSDEDGWELRYEDWGTVAYPDVPGREEQRWACSVPEEHASSQCPAWWAAEPRVVRVANGIPNRVDRLTALGNAQIPYVAATAFRILSAGVVPSA